MDWKYFQSSNTLAYFPKNRCHFYTRLMQKHNWYVISNLQHFVCQSIFLEKMGWKYFPGWYTLAYFPKNSSLLYATDAETQLIPYIKFTTFHMSVHNLRKKRLKYFTGTNTLAYFPPKVIVTFRPNWCTKKQYLISNLQHFICQSTI